jgi:hypothetical protein
MTDSAGFIGYMIYMPSISETEQIIAVDMFMCWKKTTVQKRRNGT